MSVIITNLYIGLNSETESQVVSAQELSLIVDLR